jgi:signal transduction histidine kinase
MREALDEAGLRRLIVVGRGLVSDFDLETVLQRVLAAAVEVTGARYAALGVLDEDRSGLERFLHLGIDRETTERIGDLPTGLGVLGSLIRRPEPLRLRDVSEHPDSAGFPADHPPMRSFLGVPILIRGTEWGNLYMTEKQGAEQFDAADEEAAVILADWAAIAIENARSVAADRLRHAIDAAERERKSWARELHDETLQGLAALRVLLGAGLRGGAESLESAASRALGQIDAEISGLRALISDLRPGALDELGLGAALESLGHRLEERYPGSEIRVSVAAAIRDRSLPGSLETAIYRVVQEALNNGLRHGSARRLQVQVHDREGTVETTIRDDGGGFDVDRVGEGFGLVGMRERAHLAHGRLAIDTAPGSGTVITLTVPVPRRPRDPDSVAFAGLEPAGGELS